MTRAIFLGEVCEVLGPHPLWPPLVYIVPKGWGWAILVSANMLRPLPVRLATVDGKVLA